MVELSHIFPCGTNPHNWLLWFRPGPRLIFTVLISFSFFLFMHNSMLLLFQTPLTVQQVYNVENHGSYHLDVHHSHHMEQQVRESTEQHNDAIVAKKTSNTLNKLKELNDNQHEALKRSVAEKRAERAKRHHAAQLQIEVDSYDPRSAVSFAIPVGGRTKRARQLNDIVSNLINGGALTSNIFVFEDVLSRPNQQADPDVAQVAAKHGITVVPSIVHRERPEDQSNFGIHLARHYKFFLDYLLVHHEEDVDPTDKNHHGRPFEFVVVIEDDLVLAEDFVKYFYSMSRVMRVDPTLYCVSAHQDNAFFGTSYEPPKSLIDSGKLTELDALGFDFRRGNHFMAPGWMTSKDIYTHVVRPKWLDDQGEYAFKDQLHLRNGHWDRFFDSLIGTKDCIFPEIPRIIHQGADGFTVDQRAQMELYSNLKLSSLPISVSYGDLSRLTKQGYIDSIEEFISQATYLHSLEEARNYRLTKLVYVIPTNSDKDEKWNNIINRFFGLIGVGGYGGYEGYVKVRGIFQGVVFIRWITNLVMLVGTYSPHINLVMKMELNAEKMEITHAGCYSDGDSRDLPYLVPYYMSSLLSPRACLGSCLASGFAYAGLQNGEECWCGTRYGSHGAAGNAQSCQHTCGGPLSHSVLEKHIGEGDKKLDLGLIESDKTPYPFPITCGGPWKNSVFWRNDDHEKMDQEQDLLKKLASVLRDGDAEADQQGGASKPAHGSLEQRVTAIRAQLPSYRLALLPPPDVLYLKGDYGQNCNDVCEGASTPTRPLVCDESLFPLLHRSCPILRGLFGCARCKEEEDIQYGIFTPSGTDQFCLLSKGRYIRCNAKPTGEWQRACVCKIQRD